MTPEQWARVFRAGQRAVVESSEATPDAVMEDALRGMAEECDAIAAEPHTGEKDNP